MEKNGSMPETSRARQAQKARPAHKENPVRKARRAKPAHRAYKVKLGRRDHKAHQDQQAPKAP